jgi:acetate kinase
MSETILVVNAGSSSLKFELFEVEAGDTLARRLKGRVDGIGTHPRLIVRDAHGAPLLNEEHPVSSVGDLPAALALAQMRLRDHVGGVAPAALGHRVVHGGPSYLAPTLVDDTVLTTLERLVPLAPLHQPNNLAPIRAVRARNPELPQVACFDTAFHRSHPEVADRFAIPESLYAEGVRRYGFHGLSYEYIARRLPEVAPEIAGGRIVVAHLGSGASMCAMVDRHSIESSMGFTALDGLPMGTRPGQLDPGVVLYLLAAKRMDATAIERLLYHDCGLKGLSGISNDVRDLLASDDPRADRALEIFIYRAALMAGALAAAMEGIDGLVFTAGVGENAPVIRERIARRLGWLGVELDPAANGEGRARISRAGARVGCYVIPTDEELMIGLHTLRVLRTRSAEPRR